MNTNFLLGRKFTIFALSDACGGKLAQRFFFFNSLAGLIKAVAWSPPAAFQNSEDSASLGSARLGSAGHGQEPSELPSPGAPPPLGLLSARRSAQPCRGRLSPARSPRPPGTSAGAGAGCPLHAVPPRSVGKPRAAFPRGDTKGGRGSRDAWAGAEGGERDGTGLTVRAGRVIGVGSARRVPVVHPAQPLQAGIVHAALVVHRHHGEVRHRGSPRAVCSRPARPGPAFQPRALTSSGKPGPGLHLPPGRPPGWARGCQEGARPRDSAWADRRMALRPRADTQQVAEPAAERRGL